MSRAMRLLLAIVFLVQCAVSVTATCYAPDGSEKTASDLGPCSSEGPLSNICCNVNRPKAPGTSTNASEIRDTCLPNGLCENLSLLKDGSQYLQWGRNYCTNRDWSTGQCLDNICTDTANGRSGSRRLIPCTGKNTSITWCCGDSDDCCTSDDQSSLVSLSPTFTIAEVATSSGTSASSSVSSAIETTSVASAAEQTSTPIASPTSASANAVSSPPASSPSNTANASAQTAEETSLSKGAIAGISIGAIAGAILLVALGVWISKALIWRREAHAAQAQNHLAYYYPGPDVEGYPAAPQKYAYYAEVDATPPPVEVSSYADPVEAPNTEVNTRSGGLGGFFGAKK